MIKSITQKDNYGCGITCVAFVCKVSYGYAKKNYFNKPHNATTLGYLCKDIVKALSKAKRDYYYKYVKREIRFKENTIVFIKRSEKYPAGHYLVRTKNGWMDPWINFNKLKPDIKKAKSGFRKRLPGRAVYAIMPNS